MHFDDRLGTVLRLRADGQAVQRIQFRQLLDLLGTSPAEARGDLLDAAYVRLIELAGAVPAEELATAAQDESLRIRSPRLVAALAQGEGRVAAAVLRRAELSEEQWLDLIPALPPTIRVNLRDRSDLPRRVDTLLDRLGVAARGLPGAAAVAEAALPAVAAIQDDVAIGEIEAAVSDAILAIPLPSAPDDYTVETDPGTDNATVMAPVPPPEPGGIGAIVRRIEAYRRAKQVIDQDPPADSPRLPLGEDHVLHVPAQVLAFDFATNAKGRIIWADPGVAPMVMGLKLGGDQAPGPGWLLKVLQRHQPVRNTAIGILGAPAITGPWQLDAMPWFDPLTGAYQGYRGRMRRPASAFPDRTQPTETEVRDSEADRIRTMLHELRTPVNAIQVGAEIIQQQLFGPAPHDYRALAASIAGDAARMLAAFEELERLAKLDSAAMTLETGETDLAQVVQTTLAQLSEHTRQRGSGFELVASQQPAMIHLARIEVERIVWRLLATLAGISAPGEVLDLELGSEDATIRMAMKLPAALNGREGNDVFQAGAGSIPQVLAAGVFGVGFALRLARAEAEAAGGSLVRDGEWLVLGIPGLTRSADDHTEGASTAARGS